MKLYLAYDKDTKIYKGNEYTRAAIKRKSHLYPNCETLEIEDSEWREFLKTNEKIIKIIDGKLTSEKKAKTFEELKILALNKREAYLRQTAIEWGGAWEECPKEIKDKRALARLQKTEIEAITNKKDLTIYNNF